MTPKYARWNMDRSPKMKLMTMDKKSPSLCLKFTPGSRLEPTDALKMVDSFLRNLEHINTMLTYLEQSLSKIIALNLTLGWNID